MVTAKQIFDNLKLEVNKLIKSNAHREVTPLTNYKIPGIYMIYINNFNDNKVIPIYIGQSVDVQRRYKEHYTEILALNRLSYDEYYKYFFSKKSSFYEGKFKSCKIFKYMIENRCLLSDFRMIIIEETNAENLNKVEREYFRKFLPSYFGFNQLNTFLNNIQLRHTKDNISESEAHQYLDDINEDIFGISNYYDYGFTQFNFEHSMVRPNNIDYYLNEKAILDKDLKLRIEELRTKLEALYKNFYSNYETINSLNAKWKILYERNEVAKSEFRQALDVLKSDLSIELSKLNINEIEEEVYNNFIRSILLEDSKYKKQFLKYIKSKDSKVDYYKLFQDSIYNLKKNYNISEETKSLFQDESNEINNFKDKLKKERYSLIFPTSRFEQFVLRDNLKVYPKEIEVKENLFNTCHIKIYISNNSVQRGYIYKDPDILKIEFCYKDYEGKTYEKYYYIENETTLNCKRGIKYYEKSFINIFDFKRNHFSITSLIDNEMNNSFISTLAEYKHGINDYTIKDKDLTPLLDVIYEIQELIDEETGFEVKLTESKLALSRCYLGNDPNNTFFEQIINKKLPRIRKKHRTNTNNI